MKKLIIILMSFMLATSIPAEAGIFDFISHISSNVKMNKRYREFKQRKKENLQNQFIVQTYYYKGGQRHGSKRF